MYFRGKDCSKNLILYWKGLTQGYSTDGGSGWQSAILKFTLQS